MGPWNIAANMYGMYPNAYNNQVALNDLSDLDLYSPMGAMGMNGSIFPGMGGLGMGSIGTGYPMTPMYGGGGNYEDYYKNYEKYQDFMIDSQVRRQQKMRNADSRANSPMKGVEIAADILREKVMQNEQQQIIPAFNAFVESVAAMNGNKSQKETINDALTLYKQKYNVTLTQDIRQYGNSSFLQGLYQSVTFGWADNKTKEENISELTGQPVSRYEKAKKVAGNATGGAIIGIGSAIGINCLWKVKKPFLKALFRVPVLAAIGGIAAAVMSFATKES